VKTTIIIGVAALAAVLAAPPARSTELTVTVNGIEKAEGQICCALYGPDREFLEPSAAIGWAWVGAAGASAECRFTGIAGGSYAVAVFHDQNGNRTNDANLFGIPTEPWGVSNNARPMFRAPTFEEAAVSVADGETREIGVTIETTLP
jgi:uncharacterized protein (DUF2141 family)